MFARKYWRIIRTNSTDGTRLLYAGTSHDGQNAYINNTTYIWSDPEYTRDTNYIYVYWNNASFKDKLSSWYTSNITGINDNMVESIVYCNDTSYTDMSSSWGTNGRSFGARDRLVSAKRPSYSCNTNQFGSAAKVGMMTADEVVFAGGVYNTKAPNTYYYRNSISSGCIEGHKDPCSVTGDNYWWTMSPSEFYYYYPRVLDVFNDSPGMLSYDNIDSKNAVRPVITLKTEVLVSGSGTTDDPFIPSL